MLFGQDFSISGFTEQGAGAQLGAFWTGFQDLRDCYNSHPVHPVYFFARFLGKQKSYPVHPENHVHPV